MTRASVIFAIMAVALACTTQWIAAQQQQSTTPTAQQVNAANSNSAPAPVSAQNLAPSRPAMPPSATQDRIEGEKRFRSNCSRCHQTPHKFSPRAMATIVRHMRVRATLTDEDARLILKYMSQ
jgi:mono/diheme cytochrome c family protein